MANSRFYSNNAVQGALGNPGGVSSSATSIWLTGTPSGYPGSFPFTLVMDPGTSLEECVSVASGAGTAASPWVVTRGYDGTLAQPHGPLAVVTHMFSAGDMTTSRTHEASDQSSPPHGLPASAWLGAAFAVIQETTLAVSTATVITFNSIPQTYAHLMLVVQGRLTVSNAKSGEAVCTVNGDTASKYSYIDNGVVAVTALQQPAATKANSASAWNSFIQLPGSQIGTSVNAGGGFALFPNYAGTTLNKFALAMSGWGNGTDGNVAGFLRYCFYNPSSQVGISSLAIAASQSTFQAGTFAGLYGLGG